VSQSTPHNERSFEAAADLSDKQYYFVEITAENKVNAASTLGEIRDIIEIGPLGRTRI